ncbi:MAG: ABC-type transport auxiliary lipoprotein family protein [Acidiphilium sp.]|nr:ABC-type transport auxiliary lipoprotein family protein [Acidiphilium sp.]MDD4934513.1 ABC-type transport auxiliary lipoprotein family protein [Acidiphilium sp.]
MTFNRRHLLLATPLALAGCGGILAKQPYLARADWPLAPPPPASGGSIASRGIVQVQSLSAGPTLSERGLITLLPDGSIHLGYYNRWATSPAQAVTAALIAWLQASGEFAAVVGEGSSLTPSLIVEGTLDTLLADPTNHIARAALTLVVAKPVGIGERPIAQRRLTATAPLTGATAPDLVAAQRAALGLVMGQAVAMVSRAGSVVP